MRLTLSAARTSKLVLAASLFIVLSSGVTLWAMTDLATDPSYEAGSYSSEDWMWWLSFTCANLAALAALCLALWKIDYRTLLLAAALSSYSLLAPFGILAAVLVWWGRKNNTLWQAIGKDQREGDLLQVGRNDLYPPYGQVIKKKSVALGWLLLIFGLMGVILAVVIYPTWQHNREVLSEAEYFGAATQEMYDTVAIQTVVVLGGFMVGTPMFLGGIYLVARASSYNSRIEDAMIERSLQQPGFPYQQTPAFHQVPPGQKVFCEYCGAPLSYGAAFCAGCGRRIERKGV